jgi:hypothetical protein
MTREEKIAKLSKIRVVVTDIIATYDMGLEFTTMTAKGVTTQMGNIGQWPCFVFNLKDEKLRQVVDALRIGKKVCNDEILNSLLGITLTTYRESYLEEYCITEERLISEILRQIRENLKGIQGLVDRLYTYATLESWNLQIEFFATEEALADFFIENWGTAEESYEYMLDEELDVYYDCAEKENFYSLPYTKIGFNE